MNSVMQAYQERLLARKQKRAELEKVEEQKQKAARFCGDFNDEDSGLTTFDRLIGFTKLFEIHPQVRGHYIVHRPGCAMKKPRIDRVLVPKPAAVSRGFDRVVGIEGKCSGDKVGPAITQCIDYSYAVFNVGIYRLSLGVIFLWPMEVQYGSIASIMAQNRIGTATLSDCGHDIKLQYASKNVLQITSRGVEIRPFTNAGNRQGSR